MLTIYLNYNDTKMNIVEIKNLISIWMGSSRLHNRYPEILPTQTDMNTALLPSAASPVFIVPLSASATTSQFSKSRSLFPVSKEEVLLGRTATPGAPAASFTVCSTAR